LGRAVGVVLAAERQTAQMTLHLVANDVLRSPCRRR
jgi:hypothetical protein